MVKWLSPAEIDVLQDVEYLLKKKEIISKTVTSFSLIERLLEKEISKIASQLPQGTLTKTGKISKGENYHSLPYVVLDFPRLFSSTNTFSFRLMLYWGHGFSSSLHLDGHSLKQFRGPLASAHYSSLDYLAISEDPWEYRFTSDHFTQISLLSQKQLYDVVNKKTFIKLYRTLPLEKFYQIENFALNSFRAYMSYLQIKNNS